jgi:hypothetical protein
VNDVAHRMATLFSGASLMYTISMVKKRRRQGKAATAAPPRISDGMMRGSSKNGLGAKKKLSSDYKDLRVRSRATNIPPGPAIDADQFQFRAMHGLKHFFGAWGLYEVDQPHAHPTEHAASNPICELV